MSNPTQLTPYDEKPSAFEIEHSSNKGLQATEFEETQLKSSLDRLSLWKSAWVFRRTVLICLVAGFCAAPDGFQVGISASIIANKGFIAQFKPEGATALLPAHVSVFGGIFSAGQVLGQLGIQDVGERLGRKIAMYTCIFFLLLGVITETVSTSWWHWMIGKLLAGMGIGAVQATIPVYINEMAPAQLRGFLVVSYSLWTNLGVLTSAIALKLRATTDPLDWKTPVLIQFGMVALTFAMTWFLPESPWWAASRGKMAVAEKVLRENYGGVAGYNVERELSIIVATIEQQKQYDLAVKAEGPLAIFKGLNGKRFLIGCWPKVLQLLVGISIFNTYATYFFQLAGNKDPFLVTIIIQTTALLAVILDAFLVDKLGRRFMLLAGFGGACTGVLLIAIIGMMDYTTPSLGAALVFAGVFANFCNTFQTSTSYAYLTEMPEQRFRARATGWGLAYCNCYAILINFTLPLLLGKWNVRAVWMFVILGIPGTVLAYFIMPESMRRSQAEIQEMFVDRVNLRKWKGYKTNVERDLDAREGRAEL